MSDTDRQHARILYILVVPAQGRECGMYRRCEGGRERMDVQLDRRRGVYSDVLYNATMMNLTRSQTATVRGIPSSGGYTEVAQRAGGGAKRVMVVMSMNGRCRGMQRIRDGRWMNTEIEQ